MYDKWIETADRQPPKDGKYWATLQFENGDILPEPEVLVFFRDDDGTPLWAINGWLKDSGVTVLAWMPYIVPDLYMPATVQTYKKDGTDMETIEVQTKGEVKEIMERAERCRFPEPVVTWKFKEAE